MAVATSEKGSQKVIKPHEVNSDKEQPGTRALSLDAKLPRELKLEEQSGK